MVESKEAIYEIFSAHGNMDDLVYFAELMKDYEKIINYYIHEENYCKALDRFNKTSTNWRKFGLICIIYY